MHVLCDGYLQKIMFDLYENKKEVSLQFLGTPIRNSLKYVDSFRRQNMRMNMTFHYAFILCMLYNQAVRVCGCILMRPIFITNRMTFLGWPGFIIGPSHGGGRAVFWLDISIEKRRRTDTVLLKVCPDTEAYLAGLSGWVKCNYFRGRKLGWTTLILVPSRGQHVTSALVPSHPSVQ